MRKTDTEMILDKWEDSNESDTKRQTDKIRYIRGYYGRVLFLKSHDRIKFSIVSHRQYIIILTLSIIIILRFSVII